MDPLFHFSLRAFFGLIFAAAVLHKLRDWRRFVEVVENFAIAPARARHCLAAIVVALELSAIVLLIIGSASVAGGFVAGLFGSYGALIFFNIQRGRKSIDCGCSWVKSATLSFDYVLRNAVLTVASLLLMVQVGGRSLLAIDLVNAVCFAIVAVGAYFLFDAVLHLKSQGAFND